MECGDIGGWISIHFRPAKTARGWRTPLQGTPGFPDTVFVHGRLKRLVIAEFKSAKGKLSPTQKLWVEALKAVPGIEMFVWRPEDMVEIEQVLLGHMQHRAA